MDEKRLERFRVRYSVPLRAYTLVYANNEEEAARIAVTRWGVRRIESNWEAAELPSEPEEVKTWQVDGRWLLLVDVDEASLRVDEQQFAVRLRGALGQPHEPTATLYTAMLSYTLSTTDDVEATDEEATRDAADDWWERVEGPESIQDPGPQGFWFELDVEDSWIDVELAA